MFYLIKLVLNILPKQKLEKSWSQTTIKRTQFTDKKEKEPNLGMHISKPKDELNFLPLS